MGSEMCIRDRSGGTTPAISMPKATTSVDGYLSSTDWTTFNSKGSGTVSSVSVVSANGLAGTVATATTTPAITLSTTITGLLKGNGTAISAATSGTDYAPATSGTSILYGNGSGGFSNVTIGTGVAFAGGTLSATGSGGTVTSVTGTAPVVSSGGTTPAISMAAATTSVNGYLTSTDWTTFNNKGSGSVTSVAQSFTGGLISVAGSPITTSGTLALTVAGTSGGIPYFSSASTWATSALLTNNAIMLGGGAAATPKTTTTGTGVVTALGVNTGTAGAFVVNGGDLGTPSAGVVTNLTGTASININGTVGATTKNTGAFTTLSSTGSASFVTSSGNVGMGTTGVAGYVLTTQSSTSDASLSRHHKANAGGGTAYTAECTQTTTGVAASTVIAGLEDASFIIVRGSDGAGNEFMDNLISTNSGTPTVLHSVTLSGVPSVRVYTIASFNLKLAMASGTYSTNVMWFQMTAR